MEKKWRSTSNSLTFKNIIKRCFQYLILKIIVNHNSICPDGDCWVKLYTDFEEDSNGYHHVTPQWFSETSGRFDLLIESSPTIGRCQYNGMTVVSSRFDSDSYWEIESGLSFTFGLYNPFESFYTQQGDIIKVRDTTVTLDYFQGQIILAR